MDAVWTRSSSPTFGADGFGLCNIAYDEDHGPKEDCIQSSGAGYYVVPADQGLTHNSFSGAPNGFFAPGGTAVWQAEAAFEWLLTAAFAP